jgi:hypothetical protein
MLLSWDMFGSMMKLEVETLMEVKIGGLVTVISAFASMRNLLGVLRFVAGINEWA